MRIEVFNKQTNNRNVNAASYQIEPVRREFKGIRVLLAGYADFVWDPDKKMFLSINATYLDNRDPDGIRWELGPWRDNSKDMSIIKEHEEWLKGEEGMNKVFNLKAFYKKAYYEDVKGYMNGNDRAWPNCLKQKMDGKNKNQQEAYLDCLKEYNEWPKDKWDLTYTGTKNDSEEVRPDQKTPGAKELKKE
jgi:hypothetical protein